MLNQSIVDFSKIVANPAVHQAKIPAIMDKVIQDRIDSNPQQSLNRIYDLVKFDVPLYHYDLSISVDELKRDVARFKMNDPELKEDASVGNKSSGSSMAKIFSGSIEEIMEIERVNSKFKNMSFDILLDLVVCGRRDSFMLFMAVGQCGGERWLQCQQNLSSISKS